MGPHNWITTIIRCSRHRHECTPICVRVEREVPDLLRCSPGGGSFSGEAGPADPRDCPCGGRFDVSELSRRVGDALRLGVGEWIRRGAVVIDY